MKRFAVALLTASLALAGCKTVEHQAETEAEIPMSELRTQVIQQLRAAGASRAQIREVERQLEAVERQMKQMQRQVKKLENADP